MITVGAVVESESFGASVTTFAAAADCVSLVSQLDNPAVVKRLYVLAAGNPSFETSLIAQRFLKTVDNVQSMLKVIADINADATSRSLLLEIIRSNTELAILAYEQGMITVCVDIVKENKSYDLVAVAIDMLNTTKLECHRCLLMKTLGEFLCDLEIGDETLKLKTAQTLRRLSGWRYSETETWYTYRYSCIFDLVEEAGAVESICNTLRSTSSADIAMEICYLVTAFLFKYSKEGFSVFLDVGIVDILLHKLESFDSNVVSCTPPLVTLEAVTRTEAGISQIIGTPMDLENILSKLLGLERFKMQDGLPLLENSVYTRSLLSILSRISFSTRISPLINQLMDVDDPNSIFWVGFFMRHSMSGAICFRTKVYDLLTSSLTTSDGACAILELHTVHLLRGYLVHCEKKYIDVLVSKGILKILMATVMGESDTNSLVLIYALRCISSICDGSQVALREVYSSGIIQYLPSGIEHGSYHVFDACNDLLKKILEVEEGALKLPMTKLLHAFSARLNIPDMYFENTHSYDSSPFPCAQKVAETIKSVVEMQPPHTKEVIREQLFQTVFEQVWKLVRRLTFTGIVYFKIMTKFMDLLKCLAKCKLFKSVQNAALARISLIEITESEFLEAVYFLYSFDENIDDGVAKEKLSHILDGQLYQQMTCERRAHICLALSRSCFSKSFIAKYCQRVIFESISHVLNEALMFSWDEVYGAMMLTYHVVDKSSDDIVDVVLSRNILKNILTYYQNSQILIHTNIILLLLSSVLQKAIRVGEAKLENVACVLIDNDIGVIIGELARDDRAEKKYPSLMKIMGYLIAAKTGSVKLGPLLQDFSFQQLITMRGVCSEAMFAIINDEKVFNRVVDNVKSLSSWECLPRDEKCCALELFCCFAFPMSPYKSISMTFIPHVNSLLRTHTSKLSSSFCGICHNSLRFLVLGILNGYCESNNFNSPELVDLIFQLAINSYKVSNYDERFNDTAILICTCLDKNTANSVGFVKHFVSTLISSVSGTNGVVLSAVIELCKKLYPSNNTDIIVNKLEAIFVEAGGLQALMTIINVPVIDRIRPVVFNACNVVGFLLECEEAICKFDELNGSNITLALLRDEVNIPQYFLYILLKYIIRTTWSNSSRLLDGGLLDVLTPAALEGVKSKGFFMTLQILQLICVRGSDRHREKIAKSETCEIIVQFLIDGSCPHDYVARASYLLGYNLQFNPRARSYIAGLVDLISISDPRVALGVIEKLKGVCDSQCRYVFEFLNTHSISTKLLPIYEHDKYNQSERGTIAGFIFLLARETPKEFASFGKALIKKIRSRLDDFETPNNSPKIISYIAKYSQNAKAFIISSMHQITSDYDSGNEQYACIILKMLHSFCASHDGMSVLVEGGAINVLSQILAIARTKDMKIAILNLLDRLSALECNRSKLSDIIEPVFQLITSHVHMELNDQLLVESSEFTETDAKNSFTFNCFLSHDWGIDELGRNNHERVSKINSLLKSKGCKTWFDEEQMRGSIASKMAKGVADSTAFVVFLTKNYILKASGLGSKGEDDNCFFEFDTAALERGRSNMIAVILEPSCRDTSKWAAGIVKGKLGTKLYIDLSGNENEESFQEGIAKLLREISLLSGKSFETDSVTLNSNAESLKSRRYKDVAYSESDREIGKKGIELLASLSLSESNRSAFERIDSLLPNLEYFCENKALEIVTPLYSLAVLANVYCPYLDLPSHSEENSNRNTKIRQCLKSCDYFNLLRESVKRAATSSKTDRGQLASLEAFLLCTVSLTYMEEFCEDEITLTFLEDLVTILIESSESLVSLEIVHKMHICDVFTKFCQNEKCRKKLISLKVGELVRGINDSVKANDDVQDNARLWFSSKQTMEALTGQLEISNNANFKASQLIEKGSAMTVKEIAAIPVFQTFISYKRTSAQDFARLLHSIITGNGWSCFLDVENLDRIDMLSVLVAGADVFVCILSDDVFHSPFWKQELNYAIKAGIPVVLVVKDGSRFPDTYGQLTEPFPSYDLIDKEFSGDLERCREVFKSKAIHHSNEYFRSFSVNFLKKVEAVLDEMNQKYQSAAKKKEIIIGRRQSILSIDKQATDTIVNVIPRAQESASVNPVAVQIQHPQTPNQKSPNASQISFSNQPQPPIAYTNQPPHQIYPSHSHYSGFHSPHQYMNQPHHQVSHASIHPHPQMLYPTINPQFQIQPLAYNYTSIQPYMPLAQPQSPLSYAGSSLTTPHSPTYSPQSSMILGNYESSSNSPGLLTVTEVIKQIFGIDPSTPLLETINIVETSLFGAVGNASFPSRVQAIKSALGLP